MIPYPATIVLSAQLEIDKSLTITGPGAEQLAISGNQQGRVFLIDGTASMVVQISGVTIRDGKVGSNPCGGLYNKDAQLTLDHVIITANQTNGRGGGIHNAHGLVTVRDSLISDNTAVAGGGIYNNGSGASGGTVHVVRSTISGNATKNGPGGGMHNNYGVVTVAESTLSGNQAPNGHRGGGLYNLRGEMSVTNSTVSGNASKHGPGVWNQNGTLRLTHGTITQNTGTSSLSGAALYSHTSLSGALHLGQTLIAGNSSAGAPDDCEATAGSLATDAGNLIVSQDQCGTPVITSDPQLGPLQDHGGPTATHALLGGSSAIDVIPYGTNGCGTTWTTDQRGGVYGRPFPAGGACDIGAHESVTQLTVRKRGSGSGTMLVNGQECGPACEDMQIPFTEHTVVNLEAIPEPGSYFVRWEDEPGQPLEGIVYEATDVSVYAVFEISE